MATSVRPPEETEARLNALAQRTGRTKTYHLRERVERGPKELKDYYLAVEVMERVRRGEEEILSGEEF
jgi:RHH-type rel operon transcriptional repressor/antitoxin RelB